MKILFITTDEGQSTSPDRAQGDLLENSILRGLRDVLGGDLVDYPKKKVLYGDFSVVEKTALHGRGFSLYDPPICDISNRSLDQDFDFLIYGTAYAYGMKDRPELEARAKNVFWLDGHDLFGVAPSGIYYSVNEQRVIGNQAKPSFKRELVIPEPGVFPIGFGIPEQKIRPLSARNKTQLFQKTAPDASLFREIRDLGGSRQHHKFTNEEDYYDDLSASWFGLTCGKGGWDCLRHYEIMAASSVLLFRGYSDKPPLCSPIDIPTISYSSPEELDEITKTLVKNGRPTDQYSDLLSAQRKWLEQNGTTTARAKQILEVLSNWK